MGLGRRNFLKGVGGAAALATLGAPESSRAEYALFNGTAYKVLEIFLPGGLSHRDTMWTWPNASAPFCTSVFTNQCRWGSDGKDAWGKVEWATDALGPAQNGKVDTTWLPDKLTPYVIGSAKCSPAFAGLVRGGGTSRPSLLGVTRVLAMHHMPPELPPHEAASAYALTGSRMGRANFGGMGAAILHKHTAAGVLPHPATAVVLHSPISAQYVDWATATGVFGPAYRPLSIQFGDNQLMTRLGAAVTRNAERGALDDLYATQYGDLLKYGSPQVSVRSDAFAAWSGGFNHVGRASELSTLLSSIGFDASDTTSVTPTPSVGITRTQKMIKAAADLLKGSVTKYVCVMDAGAIGTLDTHNTQTLAGDPWMNHSRVHNFNLWWVLSQVHKQFTPTDLQSTLVVIHTEFGRISGGELSSHWPYAYGAVVLGGPIFQSASVGSVNNDEFATGAITPTDLRAAMYLAAQVEPFDLPAGAAATPFKARDLLHLDYGKRVPEGFNSLGLSTAALDGAVNDTSLKYDLRHGLANTIFGAS